MSHHARTLFAIPAVLAVLAACGGPGGATTARPSGGTQAPQQTTAASSAGARTTAPSAAATAAATTQPSAAAGGVVEGDLAAVCEAGSNEGTLVYWNNLENPDPIFAAFNEAYPDIQIESTQLRPDDSAQRVLTEASAGRVTADLIYGGLDVFDPVLDGGLINQEIDWNGFGVPEDTQSQGMVRIYRVAGGLGYNTDSYSADEMPSTWEELIDAKWDGQVVVDPRGRPFDQLSLAEGWGEEATIDYVNRLKETVNPIIIEGGTAGMEAVGSGQYAITTGGRSAETLEQQDAGAPIDIKYLDIVPTLDAYHAVLTDAAHPNAAACWVGWVATAGKQIHDESEFKSNETVPSNAPADAEILAIDTPEKAEEVSRMSDLIGQIWVTE
jgi:iron(III) transport system substrate-binding protein